MSPSFVRHHRLQRKKLVVTLFMGRQGMPLALCEVTWKAVTFDNEYSHDLFAIDTVLIWAKIVSHAYPTFQTSDDLLNALSDLQTPDAYLRDSPEMVRICPGCARKPTSSFKSSTRQRPASGHVRRRYQGACLHLQIERVPLYLLRHLAHCWPDHGHPESSLWCRCITFQTAGYFFLQSWPATRDVALHTLIQVSLVTEPFALELFGTDMQKIVLQDGCQIGFLDASTPSLCPAMWTGATASTRLVHRLCT